MKRSPLLRLLPLALLVGVITSCGPGDPIPGSSGKTTIRFWNGFSGPDGETMRQIVRKFNASHKDVEVTMEIIPWGTYYDKVTLGLAFGGAPDLFILHANRLPEYASHGVLEPVGDDMRKAGLGPDKYYPQTWKAAQWDGVNIALPLDMHPLGLYYNTKLFKEAGIDHPPTNYQEFVEDAKKLTKKLPDGTQQWGFEFTNLSSISWMFMDQHGGSMLTPDLKSPAMNTPAVKEALDQMADLIYKEKITPKPEGANGWIGFRTGQVGMAFEGVYMKADLDNAKLPYAGAPVPQFGPKKATWGGSHMLCMPKGNDRKRRAAAWEFAKFLSDNSLDWAKGGQVPARKDIAALPEFQALPIQSEFAKGVPYLVYEPGSVDFNLVANFKDSAVERILNRITTPDYALATADRRIASVLARSGRESGTR